MTLKPIGDRVLIKPSVVATETASGLALVEHRKPDQTGTVVAVGPCPHPLRADAAEMADWVDTLTCSDDPQDVWHRCADLLRRATQREPEVKVGDFVVFSWQAGQEIFVEDGEDRYLMMREADILAVVETA